MSILVIFSGVGYNPIKVLLVEISHLIRWHLDCCHCSIMVNVQCSMFNEIYSGGYCGGVPPLPIPNREVKPACADGTAMQCGRVGGRHFFKRSPESEMIQGFVFYVDSEKDCSRFRKHIIYNFEKSAFCIPKISVKI